MGEFILEKRRFTKSLLILLLVTSVLALMVYLAVIGSLWLLVVFGLMFIVSAAMVLYKVWRTISEGQLSGRGGVTFKGDSPVSFWLGIAAYGLQGAFFLFVGLAFLGLAPHWFIELLRSMHNHR